MQSSGPQQSLESFHHAPIDEQTFEAAEWGLERCTHASRGFRLDWANRGVTLRPEGPRWTIKNDKSGRIGASNEAKSRQISSLLASLVIFSVTRRVCLCLTEILRAIKWLRNRSISGGLKFLPFRNGIWIRVGGFEWAKMIETSSSFQFVLFCFVLTSRI